MPTVVVILRSPLGRSRLSVSLARADFELHEHVVGGSVEQLALFGEDEPARVPVKQRHRELLLEGAHLARHGRLREAEVLARVGEAAGFGSGVKYLQLVPIHDQPIRARETPLSAARDCREPGTARWLLSRSRTRGTGIPHCYSAAARSTSCAAARKRSASSAAMQPMPAAVTAWRYTSSATSPAANTPGTDVAVDGAVLM